jgi:membrane fusion protein, multidrug efflux system
MPPTPDSNSASAGASGVDAQEKRPPLYKRTGVIIASMILIPVILGIAALFIAHAWTRESTDDAFVDANIVFIAPRVAGNVIALHVNDNQLVSQGDPLFEIDPSEYQEAVNQDKQTVIADEAKAESQQASYEQSVAHVQTVKAISESTKASTQQARANAEQLSDDLARNKALAATGVISAQEYDDSSKSTLGAIANLNSKAAQQDSATAYEAEAGKQVQSAKAQWDSARAAIGEAKAALAQAQLQLSYTKVFAPVTGRVTQRSLNNGNYVQAGQQVMALVPTSVWITANFKETQLGHMRPGQSTEIRVDAYPGDILHGHVNSLQAGSGARFSLLPPENATGNFVKIVQRVPVKIVLDKPVDGSHVLGPGMSVEPTVIIDQSSRPTIVALILAAIASACAIVCGVMFLKRASSS